MRAMKLNKKDLLIIKKELSNRIAQLEKYNGVMIVFYGKSNYNKYLKEVKDLLAKIENKDE